MTDPIMIERQVMMDAIETIRTLCSILERKEVSEEELNTVKSLLKKWRGLKQNNTRQDT